MELWSQCYQSCSAVCAGGWAAGGAPLGAAESVHGRGGHGRPLLLEKQLFFHRYFLLLKQMRAVKSLEIDPLKIFGNTGRPWIFLCLSVENCPDGKRTVSWKLFYSVMSQMNTNLYLIQSNLSGKVPTTVCVMELVPVISFSGIIWISRHILL